MSAVPHFASPPREGERDGLTWLLGADPALRNAMSFTLLASLICLLWMGVEMDACRRGVVSERMLAVVLGINALGLAFFNTALRSGWSRRFADVGMTQWQIIFSALSMALAYVAVPYTRGAALQAMCISLVFGMFRLTPRQILLTGAVSSGVLLAAVGLLGAHPGRTFSVRDDLLPALVACLVMLMVSFVLSHFGRLRLALSEQRRALRDTLQQVEQLATRDSLTGLYNRRHMQQLVEQECLRHLRSGTPLTIALLDLDHFKRVNDTHGHAVGDEVLTAAARVLVESLRSTDLIGRWGGEEFLLLLPDTPAANAVPVLHRLRDVLREQVVAPTVPGLRVTFSAGVIEHDSATTPRQALEQADQALYAAKAAGRDCCCTSGAAQHQV
ncbi:GGDEF domain-containing protein [Aquabacterium sp.]|uniref:GGDEF domain-containing protein n=1 Tax=Aquabacterium sp. TaxID=1872578 RepID=UPI0035B0DE64